MQRVQTRTGKIGYCVNIRRIRGASGEADLPIAIHSRGWPVLLHIPCNSPSASRPHTFPTFAATLGPQISSIELRISSKLQSHPRGHHDGLRNRGKKDVLPLSKGSTYPVAKMTASPSNTLPSSSSTPPSVNLRIASPPLTLIVPFIISWLAPVSD